MKNLPTASSVLPPVSALPTLFVPHGAPTFVLQPGAAGAALRTQAANMPRPRAIVVVSAHWESEAATVGFAARPQTIHDFWGFPPELYEMQYPATGCQEASQEVLKALQAAGIKAYKDDTRGLDHGAWLPLRLMYPDADVPVLPLSIQPHLGPQHQFEVGRALAPLTAQGFLILASGNLTHNLGDYQLAAQSGGQTPAYVRQFADWFWLQLQNHELGNMLDYRAKAPGAVRAHPRDEHLLPLFVAMGAAGADASVQRFHAGIDNYVLAMDAFSFEPIH